MYTRIAQCTIKPGRKPEFSKALHEVILPQLTQQSGLVDAVELFEDTDPSQFASITFWQTKEQADTYGRELFPRFKALLDPLTYNFVVNSFNVETSTMHRIAAGKAA
ncbi:MAG: antibiotic biosynthesis monooxygenase family protein [Acidobacteriota bacterium]